MANDAVSAWLAAAGRVPLLTPAEEIHLGAAVRAWLDAPAGDGEGATLLDLIAG
jgi:hypothetical protein